MRRRTGASRTARSRPPSAPSSVRVSVVSAVPYLTRSFSLLALTSQSSILPLNLLVGMVRWRSGAALPGVVRQNLHAQDLQPQVAYAIDDAMKLNLVDALPREDRSPALRLHLHPFEGRSVAPAELAAHLYLVDLLGALAGSLFAVALHRLLSVGQNGGRSLPHWRISPGEISGFAR